MDLANIDFTIIFVVFLAIILGLVLLYIIWILVKKTLILKYQAKEVLDRVLLHVKVSKDTGKKEEEIRDSKELAILFAGVSEQLFASFSSLFQKEWQYRLYGQPHITFEIAAYNGEIFFYVSCPRDLQGLVEKQIHGFYPNASIEPVKDYNIFKNDPNQAVSAMELDENESYVFPIKTYKYLETDSLGSITNTFSKLGENNTVAIQVLIRPTDNSWRKNCEKRAKEIQGGKPSKSKGFAGAAGGLIKDLGQAAMAKPESGGAKAPEPVTPEKLTPMQEQKLKSLDEKAAKVGFETQIRIVACAENLTVADAFVSNIFSSFAQFHAPDQNGFKKGKIKNKAKTLLDFIYRNFTEKNTFILNAEELASVYHFPNKCIETPGINWLSAKDAPAPANLPTDGTLLGLSIYRGEAKNVYIKEDDRRRHIYAIGKTGVGKTNLFVNMALSDIRRGKGVAYMDPHGDAISDILPKIPKERAEDVVIFDPSDIERPMGLNLLEWKTPEQKDFVVQECVQIFYKLFDPNQTGIVGPQFEHWLRNGALTLMSDPAGGTLIEIPRLFTDQDFTNEKVIHVTDPMVQAFWKKQMAQTAQFHKSEMLNYFTSKFGRFMTNDMMRNIIGQPQSSFNFREIMDSGKIFLINLSKGKVGEVNSYLLGMILVAKIQMAAMSRADIPEEQRKDFYLYVDEFQNFATENFEYILSEARKYHLALNITNQYIAQIEEKIRDAVIGNVGTIISFRIGAPDAEFMEKEFRPVFSQDDLINVDKYHAYIKLLIDNTASKPFSLKTLLDDQPADEKLASQIRELTRLKYGREKRIVDYEIQQRAKISEAVTAGTLEAPQREGGNPMQ